MHTACNLLILRLNPHFMVFKQAIIDLFLLENVGIHTISWKISLGTSYLIKDHLGISGIEPVHLFK